MKKQKEIYNLCESCFEIKTQEKIIAGLIKQISKLTVENSCLKIISDLAIKEAKITSNWNYYFERLEKIIKESKYEE